MEEKQNNRSVTQHPENRMSVSAKKQMGKLFLTWNVVFCEELWTFQRMVEVGLISRMSSKEEWTSYVLQAMVCFSIKSIM